MDLPERLDGELDVVALLCLGQRLELGEAGVEHQLLVEAAALPELPAALDLGDRPHLVDVLRQLVADVLHHRLQLDLR